jgi:hypothetical protein
VGIPISQNPDTPEGLKVQLSVRIHRLLAELPHSTKLELERLHRTRTDFGKASMLELLHGLLARWEVLRPSEPRRSLYTTKNELGSTIGS